MAIGSWRRSILALALILVPRLGSAQEAKAPKTGIEISPFVGVVDDRPELGPSAAFLNPADNLFFGGYLGYHFANGLFLEGEGGYTLYETYNSLGTISDLDVYLFAGSLGYTIPLTESFEVFGSVGSGITRWIPSSTGTAENDLLFRYDAGARYFFTPKVALRADFGMHHVPDAFGQSASAAGVPVNDDTFWGWTGTVGISFFLGGKKDADRDGVTDAMDACPDTPRGVTVDNRGCPVDSDRDGVADYMDKCPNTPAGARVDETGCPTDSDKDGVFDGIDRCPNTPAGATVDSSGCPSDSDGDKVFDGIDQCPNTPAGATVDGKGCPKDSDNDGVFDGIDQCPGTAANSKVDARGCPESPVQRALEQEGSYTFGDVNFAFNSAELRPEAEATLREVGRVLTGRPGDRMELTGHTDSVGPDAYNQQLSVRRATAVRDWLVKNFPELNNGRFDVKGMGEAQPIADNGTAEGRSQNRRVEIRLVR